MTPDYSLHNIISLLIALALGIIFTAFNKPIATEIARGHIKTLRWIFGGRSWLPRAEYFIEVYGRITFYIGALFAFAFGALTVMTIYHLY